MIELALLDQAVPTLQAPEVPDQRSLYERGVEARLAGRFPEALELFETQLALKPEDVDSRLNAALCLIALERLDDAERELERVIDEAPDYADAYTALARVRTFKGETEGAHEVIDAAESLSLDHSDHATLRQQLSNQASNSLKASLIVTHSTLTQNLPDWVSVSPGLAWQMSDTISVDTSLLYAERFNNSNTSVRVGAAKRTGFGYVRMEVGGGANTTFLPRNTLLLGAGARTPAKGLEVSADVRTSEYESGRVTSVVPHALYTFMGGSVEAGAYYINVWDENDQHRSGYRLRSTLRPTRQWALHGDYADAPESSDGITVDVRSVAAGLEVRMSEAGAIRLTVAKELRNAYDRTDVSLALVRSF